MADETISYSPKPFVFVEDAGLHPAASAAPKSRRSERLPGLVEAYDANLGAVRERTRPLLKAAVDRWFEQRAQLRL